MIDRMKVLDTYDTMKEAISLLQCAEDASKEEHVRMTVGIAVSMLLGISHDLEGTSDEA